MSIIELEAEALKLAPEDQARLLHRLAIALDALEEPELTNEELEKRWADFEASGDKAIEASALRERARHRYGLS
jgi:cell division protein FtsB